MLRLDGPISNFNLRIYQFKFNYGNASSSIIFFLKVP